VGGGAGDGGGGVGRGEFEDSCPGVCAPVCLFVCVFVFACVRARAFVCVLYMLALTRTLAATHGEGTGSTSSKEGRVGQAAGFGCLVRCCYSSTAACLQRFR